MIKLLQEDVNYTFQQNTVSATGDNMYDHLDFELVKNNSKRWNVVSANKQTNKKKKRMEVQQAQQIPRIINQ